MINLGSVTYQSTPYTYELLFLNKISDFVTRMASLTMCDLVRQLIVADFLSGLTSWWQEVLHAFTATSGVGHQ